jgi:hypothetical protein
MDEVAGFRVLRSAGHGSRSRLLLGYDDGSTVVLKVCAAEDPRVGVELAALDRAAGEHVVALLDVAADEHGWVLVLERLPGGSLAELLDRRSGLEAGEAVTILAPLATTLERLHAAGVAHGSLSLGSVVFRDDGAPALVGFGAAELFAPGAPEVVRETVPGVLADRSALRSLVSLVLGRVTGERAVAARRLAEGMATATPGHVAEALYGLAAPAAIVFDEQTSAPPAEWRGEPAGDEAEPSRTPVLPPWILAFLPDALRERVSAEVDRLRVRWEGWPAGRRRLGLGLGAAALTVVVALAVVPPSPSTVAVDPAAGTGGVEPAEVEPGEPADGVPDDPVEAAVVLLARREECLRDLSVLCLDDVVQAGSAAQADDVALVRAVSGGAEYPSATIVEGDPVLVEQLGDSALLDLPAGSEPGSLLLLRTAEGWRIRQYLESTDLEAPAFETGTG